jgi:hypothetical protein
MRKRRPSDDYLSQKRAKRALKNARRKGLRKERIEARNTAERQARIAAFEELKQELVKKWEKQFD